MPPSHIRELLDRLPESSLVLDVGGWANPDPRADWVIDIGPCETRYGYDTLASDPAALREARAEKRTKAERFSRETWVQMDICSPEPWPFPDGMFDYVLCCQTLEDVRDPIRACEEMARVGKAGYIETPSAAVELTRGVESPLWCGWRHHRWLVERERESLVFLAKPHHIHSPFWPAIPSPRRLLPEAARPLEFTWEGSFRAREEIRVASADVDEALLGIVAGSSRPDRLGDARRRGRERAWTGYWQLRRKAGRLARRKPWGPPA